jgi:lipoprotein-releasing system ATP-binding protein
MTDKEPLLKLEAITKRYEASPDSEPVLQGVDLTVNEGDCLAITGPSGSGKSTLLNIIGTLDRPTSGNVTLDGQNLLQLDDNSLAKLRNRNIGFVFQLHHLLPQCSVLENVLVPSIVNNDRRQDIVERAGRLLNYVGLSHRLSYRPGQLSGGERQRVAVVRALINNPALLLADEPTGSLDRHGAENLAKLLVDLNKEEKVTIILVTHAGELANQMNRTFNLQDGVLTENTQS